MVCHISLGVFSFCVSLYSFQLRGIIEFHTFHYTVCAPFVNSSFCLVFTVIPPFQFIAAIHNFEPNWIVFVQSFDILPNKAFSLYLDSALVTKSDAIFYL